MTKNKLVQIHIPMQFFSIYIVNSSATHNYSTTHTVAHVQY